MKHAEHALPSTGKVCIRLDHVFALLLLISYAANISFCIILLVAFLLVSVSHSLALIADEFMIFGLPVLVVGYFVQMYILGFPGLILVPPEPGNLAESAQERLSVFVGRTAKTSGSLRPQGEIEIEGNFYPAKSESGQMISEGILVTITSVQNGKLLVRKCQDVA